MRNGSVWTAVLACVVGVGLIGCSGESSEGGGSGDGAAAKADSPRALLRNLATAIDEGDRELFVSSFQAGGERQQRMLGAMYEMTHATTGLRKKVTEKFGAEAANTVFSQGATSNTMLPVGTDWVDEVNITTDGNTATGEHPSMAEPMDMVEEDGAWYVAMPEETTTQLAGAGDKEFDQGMKMLESMAQVMTEMQPVVDQEGMTPQKLKQQMSQKMMQVMMSAMQEMEGGPNAPQGPDDMPAPDAPPAPDEMPAPNEMP